MPPPPPPSSTSTTTSSTAHLPPTQPAQRQPPKSPDRVLAEAEAQWLFTEAELANTPSIQDGMSQAEEKEIRAKGVHFIGQVGILLKLPQLTLTTASIFFQRFLMRASLKKERDGIPKLHHFQTAATALFLATKVEESCRKMKEMILAFCRVAQKNPNLQIDEQSKDWWRWRDCILHNEDVLLETLCFDLTVESPYRQLFSMLKYYGIEHDKRLRNAAWAFVTDSNKTQLCLLCSSRTIAVASLYAACKYCDASLPDDARQRPWWESQHVRLKDIRRALDYMLASYDHAANAVNGIAADGHASIYLGLSSSTTPGANPAAAAAVSTSADWDSTRLRDDDPIASPPPFASDRRASNASSVGAHKRDRDDAAPATAPANGHARAEEQDRKRTRLADGNGEGMMQREEAQRVRYSDRQAATAADDRIAAANTAMREARLDSHTREVEMDEAAEGSEEGELEE